MIELTEVFINGKCRLLTIKSGRILFIDGSNTPDLNDFFHAMEWMIKNRPVCTSAS